MVKLPFLRSFQSPSCFTRNFSPLSSGYIFNLLLSLAWRLASEWWHSPALLPTPAGTKKPSWWLGVSSQKGYSGRGLALQNSPKWHLLSLHSISNHRKQHILEVGTYKTNSVWGWIFSTSQFKHLYNWSMFRRKWSHPRTISYRFCFEFQRSQLNKTVLPKGLAILPY